MSDNSVTARCGRSYDYQQLAIMGEAFNRVWTQIAQHVGDHPASIDAARSKLADIVLTAAARGATTVDEMVARAQTASFAEPTEL